MRIPPKTGHPAKPPPRYRSRSVSRLTSRWVVFRFVTLISLPAHRRRIIERNPLLALPHSPLKLSRNRPDESCVVIGGYSIDPMQIALLEPDEQPASALFGLAIADLNAKHLAVAVRIDPGHE